MAITYDYTELSSAQILSSDSLNITTINKILTNLLSNDLALNVIDGAAPNIWECKWYNDSNISGYPKGYTVWQNTEYSPSFIKFNADKIYNYALNNSYLKAKIKPYSTSQYQLYYSILTGYPYDSYGNKLPPLFDIGNPKNNVQIKISTKDNNKDLLSNKESWKDFYIYDEEDIKNLTNLQLQYVLSDHIKNFHFNKNSSSINNKSKIEQLKSRYVQQDLNNITKYQKYISHDYPISSDGFDYIKLFVKKDNRQVFINSVAKSLSYESYYKIKEYDSITNKYGELLDSVKDGYFSILSGCNNYMAAGVDVVLNNLKSEALIDITYTATAGSVVTPGVTKSYSEIQGRESLYACTFTKVPLTADSTTSANIEDYIDDYYTLVEKTTTSNYPKLTYTFNKWFRLWNSGYLEHGGIIATKGKSIVNVNFDWIYQKNSETYEAPIYDYPTLEDSFYGNYKTISQNNGIEHDSNDNISTTNRYSVTLTPITSVLSSSLYPDNSKDYSKVNDFSNYMQNEITELKNNGFSIAIDDDSVQYYSYHVTGYKTNG